MTSLPATVIVVTVPHWNSTAYRLGTSYICGGYNEECYAFGRARLGGTDGPVIERKRAGAAEHEFLRQQRRLRQGRRSWRARGRRCALPAARAGGRRRRQDLARLSQHQPGRPG